MRRSNADGERGAVLPVVVLSLGFLIVMTAFTVDLGRLMLRRRDLQSVADVVALDLARHVDGRTVDAIEADPTWVGQQQLSTDRNDFPISGTRSLDVQLGHVTSSRQFVRDFGASIPNAVKVTAFDHVDYYFAPGGGNANRFATALGNAPAPPCAPGDCPLGAAALDYQIGSFLASASFTPERTNLLNAVLGRALGGGGGLSLDAVSYQGLANGSVTLRQITTQMGLASPNDFFVGTVNARQFFLASARALSANGGTVGAVNALNAMAATVGSNTTLAGSGVIGRGGQFSVTGSQGRTSAADVGMNVLNIVQGAAFLINGSNAISVPALTLNIAGLTTTTISLSVIEGPRVVLGARIDEATTTSQVHLVITTGVDNPVGAIGPVPASRITGSVTVDTTAGSATGTPIQIACPNNTGGVTPAAMINVTASPVAATASETLTLATTVPILGTTNVLSTTVSNATVAVTSTPGTGTFAYPAGFLPSIGTGTTQRIGGGALNLSGALGATSINSTLLGGSFLKTDLVNVMNTGVSAGIAPAVASSAIPFIGSSFGLEIGGADVGAIDMRCTGPLLVN
ncbi:MAG: hypothetical protein QOH64_1973 [Acidimicrobiaceae bacterium]